LSRVGANIKSDLLQALTKHLKFTFLASKENYDRI